MLLLSACAGGDSEGGSENAAPTRTIPIEMTDIAFSPSAVTVKKGEEVRFVFTNKGAVQHDAFVGSEVEQSAHEAQMAAGDEEMEGMHHGDSVESAVTVQPGESEEIVTTFASRGEQIIGCHEPGHYDAGMKVAVTVE